MELIRTIKGKIQTKREEELGHQAENAITLSDFGSSLYITINGIPLRPVEEDWTPKEIIAELSKLRQTYVNAKIQKLC